ncbi:MAG TPA: hypothetical protein VJ810_15445 [Blastocatellia bacterium]|nr:hypothetical protein [Blastocatellia bacterium]
MPNSQGTAIFYRSLARYARDREPQTEIERLFTQTFGDNPRAKATAANLILSLESPKREPSESRKAWIAQISSDAPTRDQQVHDLLRPILGRPLVETMPGVRVVRPAPAGEVPISPTMPMSGSSSPNMIKKYRIEFAGIYCQKEASWDQGSSSDEPYVLFTMTQRFRDPWSRRSAVYDNLPGGAGGIDSGDDFRELPPLLTLFGQGGHETAEETAIVATFMEHDFGDPDKYKEEIELLVRAAQAYAAAHGIPVPDAVANFAVDLINDLLDTDDDLIGVNTAVLSPDAFAFYASKPLTHFKQQLHYHFYTYHTDGDAKYYAMYRVIEEGKQPPPAVAKSGLGDFSVVARSPDRLDLFVRMEDKGIYTAAWDQHAANGKWRGWWRIVDGKGASSTMARAVARDSNKLDVVTRGDDKGIHLAAWDHHVAAGAWRGWWRLVGGHGASASSVTIVSRAPHMLDVFMRGEDNGIYTAAWDANAAQGEWRGWWRIVNGQGAASSNIAAVSRHPNKLDVFILGTNSRIFTAAWDQNVANGQWRGWWQILDRQAAAGTCVAAIARHAEQLDIFIVGADRHVYTAAWNQRVANAAWQGWWPVLNFKVRQGSWITAVSRGPDKLDIFAIGEDSRVWTAAWDQNVANGQWRGWWTILDLKVGPINSLAAVARRPHQLDVFAVGEDRTVWTAAWDQNVANGQWRGWWRVP